VPKLRVAPALRARFPNWLTDEALDVVAQIYCTVAPALDAVLSQRSVDRAFVDSHTLTLRLANEGVDYLSEAYGTCIGMRDDAGRVVVGPHSVQPTVVKPVVTPEFLKGEQITLFGPPDSAKMAINAMNTLHKRLPDEAPIVDVLVRQSGQVPRWGADNEDSKTPLMENLLHASENLSACFDGTLSFDEARTGRQYRLAESGLSKPIKRIPGLALPDGHHLYDQEVLPLHLTDFVLHVFHNWSNPEALVFYVPKLENEEEAAYLRSLVASTESLVKTIHPAYVLGSVRLFIVFESPRSIFRIREMADALHPYFLGGSLGWHDFLGSTARLFRHDPNYRIPVKADPNIVINHIRESHQILVDSLAPIGGIAIGGMYGVLYEDGNELSFEVSIVGYIRDVVTQLKRGLNGFWVAHPSFVRIGIALVEAYRQKVKGDGTSLVTLVTALVPRLHVRTALFEFIDGPDVNGLSRDNPMYPRGVLAADIAESDVIQNHDPDEVRYNVFQALQYLADWLSGNGCVALPATMKSHDGETVFVRVMDDLATTERSRWELWAELQHGRVSQEMFHGILDEEIEFIRTDRVEPTKRVQVKWAGETERWYPIAIQLLKDLVLTDDPVEFATELLMPYTFPTVRAHERPYDYVQQLIEGHT
jgi:malate synthase